MSGAALEAAPAEEALLPVPREGLSLAALRAFAAQHADTEYTFDDEEASFDLLTTAEVCAAVIKPATEGAGAGGAPCSYAELLLAQVRMPAVYRVFCALRLSADALRACLR